MRTRFLICFLIAGGQLLSAQNGLLERKVDVSVKNDRIEQLIEIVESNYGVSFSYGDINLSNRININYQGDLEGLLDAVFNPERIEYRLIGDQIVLKYQRFIGQNIRGKVFDEISQFPLVGATIVVLNSDPVVGTTSDALGEFEIEGLAIGRYDLLINYIGYEAKKIGQVLISSGSGVYLNVKLQESVYALDEAVVVAKFDPSKPINDMAGNSVRSFSVEETQRYAAALSDPARMVQVYPGVSAGGDDLSNEIIIRGNASRYLLWRLEGAPIPSPNHFGTLGGGGGNISMLSSRTLADSDFYTGAFPAEFGNAISGVFDLKFRNGSQSKRGYSFLIGNLGVEASTEGYFKKENGGNYLLNYRYSNTALIKRYLPTLVNQDNAFQDLSFKVNLPKGKFGKFSIFGLGGQNSSEEIFEIESSPWIPGQNEYTYLEDQKLGVLGLTHRYLINDQSYFKSALVASNYQYDDLTRLKNIDDQTDFVDVDISDFNTTQITGAVNYYNKITSKDYFHTGVALTTERFRYDYSTYVNDSSLVRFFQDAGNNYIFQYFAQWQHRFSNKFKSILGLNYIHLFLNNTYGIDPRLSLEYQFTSKQRFGLALGLYSKPEHSSTYLVEWGAPSTRVENPNRELAMMKAFHVVGSYDINFLKDWRFKTELYYQYLFNLPISSNPESDFSIVNAQDVFDIVFGSFDGENPNTFLVSEGKGINYGLEFTLEKFFSRQYYGLLTLSLFDSKFSNLKQEFYPTFHDRDILFNVLGGREWLTGKRKNNIWGLNVRFSLNGGNRYTPIDLEASTREGRTIFFPDATFLDRIPPYYRFDLGVNYKLNTASLTHTFRLDIQNILNHRNVAFRIYDNNLQAIRDFRQNGLIPFASYRIQFTEKN